MLSVTVGTSTSQVAIASASCAWLHFSSVRLRCVSNSAAIRSSLDDLEKVASQVNTQDAVVGNNMRLVDSFQASLQSQNQALQEQDSSLTDANLAESITNFNLTDQALNVALNSQGRIQQLSLLDYLR